MKIEELRIGNYYRAGIEIKGSREAKLNPMDGNRVIRLAIEHFQVFVNAPMIVEMINPIELTEEWLVKFGLIESKEGTKRIQLETDLGDLIIYIDGRNKNIKYVHQFQNLYFALTGEELNIKMDCQHEESYKGKCIICGEKFQMGETK